MHRCQFSQINIIRISLLREALITVLYLITTVPVEQGIHFVYKRKIDQVQVQVQVQVLLFLHYLQNRYNLIDIWKRQINLPLEKVSPA